MMYKVICPECGEERQVQAKKSWMEGYAPYSKICKKCCQVGKEKSDEHKAKLSESVKKLQTPELLQQKSEFRKAHPEVWQDCLIPGQGAGWNKGLRGCKTKGDYEDLLHEQCMKDCFGEHGQG